ncbi:phosphotriesterase [Thermodesulfobacteriota bacterium]
MSTVNSVLGPIDVEALGFTLMHEHIITSSAGIPQNYPELLGDDFTDRIIHGLTAAKQGGIDTIVDGTTLDLGRDVIVLANASRQTGVNIIACTGWWCEEPRFITNVSSNQLARVFVREIREGIAGTDIKAGIIKAASDVPGVTEWQETILRAAAQAHLETDVPIMLHSYSPGRIGEQQLAILKEEGVDLKRVKMDHSNDTTDIGYITWLLEQGCYLGMDRYPGRGDASSIERNEILKSLIDAGYTDRLLLSHDNPLVMVMEESPPKPRPHEEREEPNPHGYLYIKKVVLPSLREMGVPESILDRLCTVGPRNFFDS